MNPTNIRAWHDALLSGDYTQATGQLRDDTHVIEDGGEQVVGFCCLGVATECAIADGVPLTWGGMDYRLANPVWRADDYTIWDTELPPLVQQWLGVDDDNPSLVIEGRRGTWGSKTQSCIHLNDSERWTFAEIAEAIKRTWPEAFAEEVVK